MDITTDHDKGQGLRELEMIRRSDPMKDTRVRLITADDEEVHQALTPPMTPMPEVIVWQTRPFVRADDIGATTDGQGRSFYTYRETPTDQLPPEADGYTLPDD